MKKIPLAFYILSLVMSVELLAANSSHFPEGKTCAVTLSYDDALPVHYNHVAPLLESNDMRATFFLPIRFLESPDKWKLVASKGHELGNHSLFHPCRRTAEFESWLAEYYDLQEYTPGRFRDELHVANQFLDLLDGGKARTYGNTCTNLTIGDGEDEVPMDPILEEMFVASRGEVTNKPVDPERPVFSRLGHYSGDAKTFEQLKAEIEAAREQGAWIIYMFHGVGEGTHYLFISTEEHRQLIEWLHEEKDTIWTAPMVQVAQYLKETNNK